MRIAAFLCRSDVTEVIFMKTLRTLSTLTALGLVMAVSAQAQAAQGAVDEQATPPATETQPNPSADPNAASSPPQRDVTGKGAQTGSDEAPPSEQSDPSSAGSPHQRDTVSKPVGETERAGGKEKQMSGDTKPKDKLVGLPVETATGQPIGSVVDIVRDQQGKPSYAVVAIDNDTTAVPYDTASMMVRDGKLVMSQTRLANSPKVKQSEWLDQAPSTWRKQTDRYWGETRTASPNEPADPSAPTPR
jgi:hypothetical protein